MLYFHTSNWTRVVNNKKDVDTARVNEKGILFSRNRKPFIETIRKTYSLYEKIGRKWHRISDESYLSGETAAYVFSARLAEAPLTRSIRAN